MPVVLNAGAQPAEVAARSHQRHHCTLCEGEKRAPTQLCEQDEARVV